MATLAEQLARVEAAIAKAEQAQSVSSDAHSVTRASLATLYARQDVLQCRLNRQNNRGRGSLVADRRER